ncbi:hypothetical protein C8F01DRAFT_1100222 [Mycena amicta]|nr:hypothetical protein C8F01DRAFT_1100222 [Mycena amicta]
MTDTSGPGHLLSLKVMRVSRPSLASPWQPFYSSSPSFSAHSTASILSLQGQNPLPGHPKTLRDLHVSELLTLPAAFGKIELGETFSSCLCVNNESPMEVEAVSLKVEMQTASSKVLLGEFGGPDTRLTVGDALEDAVVHHEVKELGQHVLACTVTYQLPAAARLAAPVNDGSDPNLQSFRKFYKFAVTNPLSVKTKVHAPRSPSALLSKAEREKVFLEVHIQNLTTESLWFERMRFECAEGWDVFDANVIDADKEADVSGSIFAGSMSLMQPQDMRQYIYILNRQTQTLTPTVNAPGSVIPLGRLDISWRSSYGEPGRLLTSMLSKKIPLLPAPTVQPAPALPPHLKRTTASSMGGPPRPHSPQTSMSRPDSPTSLQRPGSPFRNRPPSSIAVRSQTPPPAHHAGPPSDVEVSLIVRDVPREAIRLETPFKMALTLVVSAHVSVGRRRSLLFAVQHLQPPRTSVPVLLPPPPPPPPEPYSPRITSPGFSTPSPMSATFNLQLAHQKLSEISSSARAGFKLKLADVADADSDTWTLPPPFFEGSDELSHTKPGAVFCGPSAIILQPFELETDDNGQAHGSQDFELQYMPISTGFSTVGGLRAILLEDRYVQDEDRLPPLRSEPKISKQWDIIAEIWVST